MDMGLYFRFGLVDQLSYAYQVTACLEVLEAPCITDTTPKDIRTRVLGQQTKFGLAEFEGVKSLLSYKC